MTLKRQLNGKKTMKNEMKSYLFLVEYVVFLSSAWKNVRIFPWCQNLMFSLSTLSSFSVVPGCKNTDGFCFQLSKETCSGDFGADADDDANSFDLYINDDDNDDDNDTNITRT